VLICNLYDAAEQETHNQDGTQAILEAARDALPVDLPLLPDEHTC